MSEQRRDGAKSEPIEVRCAKYERLRQLFAKDAPELAAAMPSFEEFDETERRYDLEEAEEEARRKRTLEGAREVLCSFLGHRFGYPAVDAGIRARIAAAPMADLVYWAPRLLVARRVEEVFEEMNLGRGVSRVR